MFNRTQIMVMEQVIASEKEPYCCRTCHKNDRETV